MRIASSRVLRVDRRSAALFRFAALFIAIAVAGCGVRLAPNFDRTMVDGLARANEDAMTLFATVSAGVRPNTFARRERSYDELIGKLDALRLQSQVRPNPQAPPGAAILFGGNPQAQQRVGEAMTAPTPSILTTMMKTVTMMKDTDRKTGLVPILVVNFKREFEISMEQALTYERALER
jgi:hypothetical protein